jgi:hypothetical protein
LSRKCFLNSNVPGKEFSFISYKLSPAREFSISLGGEYDFLFWVVAPYSPVEVHRRFRGARCSIIRAPIIITLTLEVASTCGTMVNLYRITGHYNPQDRLLHSGILLFNYLTERVKRNNNKFTFILSQSAMSFKSPHYCQSYS